MGIDEISRALGRIEGTLSAQHDALKGIREDVSSLKDEVKLIGTSGCPVGQSNKDRLDKLEAGHTAAGAVGGVLSAGGIIGLIETLKAYFGK